ncbi:dienelactone hydrolase [Diplocarpon rosae]|nr:dienelactone hydrolase [Diplocarpon rosae]
MLVQLSLLALLAPLSLASGPAPLAYEHPGQLFASASTKSHGASGVLTGTNSTGKFETVGGGMSSSLNTYLAYPPHQSKNNTDVAILYLSDIFGVQLINNRLLADSFARAGYLVAEPDLFDGDAIPVDGLTDPSFNRTAWNERHPTEAIDAIVASTIAGLRQEYGVKRIAATGYCFGGKYVARFLAAGKGLDAGFTAHPSNVQDSEWEAIDAPLSIAYGELDASNTPTQRAAAEAIFISQNATFQTSLYAGAEHGFAVRTNITDPKKAFAQESAYFQAVRWIDAWAK